METTYLLRDQDDRVDGEGLTWWIYLDPGSTRGTPFSHGLPLDAGRLRGWWRLPYDFDPERGDEIELVSKPTRRLIEYRLKRGVECFPETISPANYDERVDEGFADDAALYRAVYEPVYEDSEPVAERLGPREWVILDGSLPPDDGLSWQANLPAALRHREEVAHLLPGSLLGFREAVASALDEIDGVKAYTSSGKPHVSVFLSVVLPKLDPIEWQRSPFRPGMTGAERRRAREEMARTTETITRSLEIPVKSIVAGRNRAEATKAWHEALAEIVSFVRSAVARPCPNCNGRGWLEEGEEEGHDGH